MTVSSKASSLSEGPEVGMKRCAWRVCVPGVAEYWDPLEEGLGAELGGHRHLRCSPAAPPRSVCIRSSSLWSQGTFPLSHCSAAHVPPPQGCRFVNSSSKVVWLHSLPRDWFHSGLPAHVFRTAEAGKRSAGVSRMGWEEHWIENQGTQAVAPTPPLACQVSLNESFLFPASFLVHKQKIQKKELKFLLALIFWLGENPIWISIERRKDPYKSSS